MKTLTPTLLVILLSTTAQAQTSRQLNANDIGTALVGHPIIAPQDTPGARIEIQKTNSPLNFGTTRAALISQLSDTGAGASNELIPGWEFAYTWSGDGVVNPAAHFSATAHMGLWVVGTKTGDGSGQEFSCTGQLEAVGAAGYNENGCFQYQLTNLGSTNGNLSGVEGIVADGTSGTNYPTIMKNFVTRMIQYNAGTTSTIWQVSPEGTQPIGSIMSRNVNATGSFISGFDLSGLSFTSGFAFVIPNNTNYGAIDSGGTRRSLLLLDPTNNTDIALSGSSATFNVLTSSGTTTGWNVGSSGQQTIPNLLTLSGTESNQIAWTLGGQIWKANVVSGGNWYLYDNTHNKFPITVAPNTTASLTISGSTVGVTPLQFTTTYTVATLPTCNAGAKATLAVVTDASAPTYNATVAGGGAVTIPVFCNGTNWTAH